MKYIDFFPSYPSLDNPNFYQQLYEKKEFYDLSEKGKQGTFLNHQLIPSRFLSPWTFYQSLLLVHDTGTGKSGCAASTLDVLKNFDEEITMIYITSNDTLIRNFKRELLKLCPWIRKKKKSYENENTFFRRNRMYFSTFGSFERDFEKVSVLKLKKVFFILDEVHHLVTKQLKNYEKVIKYLKLIPEKKVLALTATPMRDDSLELIYLLNLVLPIPLPTGKDFIKEYLDYEKENDLYKYMWKPNKDIQFRKKIAGYVSVFRQKVENIKVEYMGENTPGLEFTKILIDKMSPNQIKTYMTTWNNREGEEDNVDIDNEEDSLYNRSIQSSLMVFPNNLYGSNGANEYTLRGKEFKKNFFEETGMIQNPKTDREKEKNLEILKNYSITYYSIIRNILKCKKQKKSVYVYSEKINGSGILRCIYLLKQCFGFESISSDYNLKQILREEKDRLIFLGNEDIIKLIELFNHSENRYGDYVRVIFGTDKTTEGITLKNVQEIHITTPGWNFGKKNQAEGRGIRFGSHNDLGEKKDIKVEIYNHCAVPNSLEDSVNYLQYFRSEIKEKNIYLFSYAMLISSIDCQLNYYQNYQSNAEDNSAQCYFEKCQYQCDGITDIELTPEKVDVGNYNTYFLDVNKKIIEEVKNLFFINQYPKTFQEIKHKLSHQKFSEFQIFYTLITMIETPILIPLNDGTKKYLLEEKGYFYLSSDRNILLWQEKQPLFELEYQKPSFRLEPNIDNMKNFLSRNKFFINEKINLFLILLKENKVKEIYSFFHSFPDFLQNIFIQEFPNLLLLKEGKYDEKTNIIKRKEDKSKNTEEVDENKIKELEINPYGLYAIPMKDSFKIRDVSDLEKTKDKRTKTKGQDVKTIEVSKLVSYILRLRNSLENDILNMTDKEFNIENHEKEFKELKDKYPIFKEKKYNKKEEELILFLMTMFSNKRRILIQIIKKEIDRLNLMVKE